MILSVIFSILSGIRGQLGPSYDPLFYDVIILTVVGVILSAIFIIVVIVAIVLKISKKSGNHKSYGKSQAIHEDTQFWVCPVCGEDTQQYQGKQYCRKCQRYL